MDLKCSNCECPILNSNLKFSCSHSLCNKCLARKIMLQKFSPLSKKLVELTCSCKGKISVPFKACLENLSQPEIKKNKNKAKSNKCFYHKEYYNSIFCINCKKFICKLCEKDKTNPGNDHSNHATLNYEEYQSTIKNKKKSLLYKSYDQCMKFIDEKEDEILNDFNEKCNQSKKVIEETFEKIKEIKEKYISKYEYEKNNLKNIFLIIKQCYNNFYADLEQKNGKIDYSTYDYISKINYQLSNIEYNSVNFEEFDTISSALNKIDTSRYYDIKFDFSKISYEQSSSIDESEGILILCPLRCIENAFACGTEKGKIKIYSKKKDDYEFQEFGVWSMDESSRTESITSLIEPKKMENYLISGSTDKIIRIFSVIKNENNCKITKDKEFINDGIILDIFQLSDRRIAYSTSDQKITILSYDNDSKKFNITIEIKNNNVGFEKCLSEIQIYESDESSKQLISGGINGLVKIWDISSGKVDEKIKFEGTKLLTYIAIINSNKLAIGTEEGFIFIFDYYSKQEHKSIAAHKNSINALFYSPFKNYLFSCSKDKNIKIWNLSSLKCINTLEKQHEKSINDIILCGNNLISCSIDKTINIYSIEGDENNNNNDDKGEKYDDFS